MFCFGNRDESTFEKPNEYNPPSDTSKSITVGAGPHFCAGASASKTLFVDVAMPMLIERFRALKLRGEVIFNGWAFRGPNKVPVQLKN